MITRQSTEDSHDALERARAFGVDLSLLTAALRLTPAERLDEAAAIAELRAVARAVAR